MPTDRIAIIGAGVAGLTAALAFARKGIASDIFEQAPALTEVGAGLQISPNASRLLQRVGVLERLEPVWNEPEWIDLVSGTSLRPLAHVPAGAFARERWGAPYGVLHRATLQAALLESVKAQPLCRLHLGRNISPGDLTGLLGQEAGQGLAIGADGVWTQTRHRVPNGPEPGFSGNVAWRFTIPAGDLASFMDPRAVAAYLGPSAHLVSYPLRETGGFNMVAIASGISPGETWEARSSEAQRHLLLGQFRRWHPAILKALQDAPAPTFWPLYQMLPGRWHNGRDTVLIGDAAHAMMPFAAQGAAMAIEDAFSLAAHVAGGTSIPEALNAFEAERVSRITRVRARGMFNRFAYHARGPVRLGRDIVLAMRPPRALAADLDWLYGYRSGD